MATADQNHRGENRVVAMREQQIRGARVAPVEQRLADGGRNLGYRDHTRVSTGAIAPRRARRFMIQVCSRRTRFSSSNAVASA